MVQLVRIRIQVAGRVQGVGFRFATRHLARSLNLTGWVRNRADGSVLLEAQGVAGSVASLLSWCSNGPVHASVETVDFTYIQPVEEAQFNIS
jgi:acylphosphatase